MAERKFGAKLTLFAATWLATLTTVRENSRPQENVHYLPKMNQTQDYGKRRRMSPSYDELIVQIKKWRSLRPKPVPR